jgi:hypothetical protein
MLDTGKRTDDQVESHDSILPALRPPGEVHGIRRLLGS